MAGANRGRVERALDLELRADGGLTRGGDRAALRALARAIDTAERAGDVVGVTRAVRAYFDVRRPVAESGGRGPGRPSVERDWDRWLAEQSAATMGDAPHSD